MSIDSECQLFRILPLELSNKIEHGVCNISPASVHEANYLKDKRNQLKDCLLLCLGAEGIYHQNIRLENPMRANQHN